MSEIAVQAASAKTTLLDIARQAQALAAGLQNAAPGDKTKPNNSIQYLLAISELLTKAAGECEGLIESTSIHSPPNKDSGMLGM